MALETLIVDPNGTIVTLRYNKFNADYGGIIDSEPRGPVVKAGTGTVRLLESSDMPQLAKGDCQ